VDSIEFQIIYEYLQNNHEEKIEPFVFKNTLTPISDISKLAVTLHVKLADKYYLAYEFSDGDPFSTEISVYKKDLLLERIEHFFETIPTESAVAFVVSGHFSCTYVLTLIKLLSRLLGRDEAIDALSDVSKVESWLSESQDIVTNSGHFGTKKTKFVIELSYGSIPKLAGNALSNYTYIDNLDKKNVLDLIAEKSKNVPGGINCNQILLDTALNFSAEFTKADADDFHIIYQYLQDNHEEQLGPFVFKNTLTPKSGISKLADILHEKLADNYHLVYRFSNSDQFSTEISVYKEDLLLERFKHFFETIPTGSAVAFVIVKETLFSRLNIFPFIKFLAKLLERQEPIDAWSSASKVDSWLSFDGQKNQDLVTQSGDFGIKKTKFVIELSYGSIPKLAKNATSKYTFIPFSIWEVLCFMDIWESMEDQQYQTIPSKIMNQVGKDPLCLQTLIGM
jgi:hypothetical protein